MREQGDGVAIDWTLVAVSSSLLPSGGAVKKKNQSRRSLPVFLSLVGVLTLTSVLLRAMQGAPLSPDAGAGFVPADSRHALLTIFNTKTPTQTARWKSIFVHHSRTFRGNAATLGRGIQGCGDHFVIGNGDGLLDGEIQFSQLWDQQQPADPMPGIAQLDAGCVSICVVGDFDQTAPSAMQLRQLQRVVQTLQERLRISSSQVWLVEHTGSAAGVGRYFPTSAFQSQLLR